ncbi:MAG TPA: bifunctional aldolase/short-chain dehydrogenase [Stellaceae bacterium]|jgi:rhamnose utilization protein RhaD (predicted bifunctional aldolase and dehydrogenase)/NAD(P)-dependent dehydrogenase (short-subunit alcohol dehydrogenase family)
MKSNWNNDEAEGFVRRYAQQGVGRDLALRVYTSRLLGRDPLLVLHGGGNTSVKTTATDLAGDAVEVLCVKGSGWDMADIEPAGLPAVRLKPLLKLRERDKLSDEDMVRYQRANLLDPSAPNPSVETLLHAFLPLKYVDHTHSTAVLSIADQPNAAALCAEIYGRRMGYVPYIMPGFALAQKAAEIYEADPAVEGLVLAKHGIFTFGADARESYERMIAMVTRAEERLAKNRKGVFAAAPLPKSVASLAAVAPILRGACAEPEAKSEGAWRRLILDFRSNPQILAYVNGAEVKRYAQQGVVTPDHTIRTKNVPLIVPVPDADDLAGFRAAARQAAEKFVSAYHVYFQRHNGRSEPKKRALDPLPRVALVPGLGLFGLGRSKKDAAIAADIAENTVLTITDAEAIGTFEALPEGELFEMEYWSLEQAKLGSVAEKPLASQVAAVTGGAGAIGAACAALFKANGAEVALLDRDSAGAEAVAKKLGGAALGLACDVTDESSVRAAFDAIAAQFGGLDILISNAGAAWQGKIGEVEEAVLRQSFELNFFAHQRVAQAAVKIMLAQGTGGCLLFNVSKQAINPGPDFGPYGLPKAATLFLSRQYALDYGKDGIRANAVNADRIRSGVLSPEMIAARSKARRLSERDYMSGNLLAREVTAEDVAQAFLHQALSLKTTADVTTVDGGNIAAALR